MRSEHKAFGFLGGDLDRIKRVPDVVELFLFSINDTSCIFTETARNARISNAPIDQFAVRDRGNASRNDC
jgi:hypothetical protein